MSNSLRPRGLQHARLPCPSPTPRACPNSCPLCQWCHPTISSSGVPFCSCLQYFSASGSFPMSQFFTSGGQRIEASASDVFPINIQDWFPYDWLIWSPCNPRDFQESSPTPKFKSVNSSALSFLYSPILTSIHDYWKKYSHDKTDLVGRVMSLLFNMLSRFVIAFLPRSKHLLISWLQSPSTVVSEPKKIKTVIVSIFPPSIAMKWWEQWKQWQTLFSWTPKSLQKSYEKPR